MKKTFLFCMSMLCALIVLGQGSVTSDPSPLISTKGGKVIIDVSGTSVSGDVYLYSWVSINGVDKSPTDWAGSINDKYKMTNDGSNKYSYTISSIQEHFGLTDEELETITEIGVIARTSGGAQTKDLFVTVQQAPKVVYSGGEGTTASPYLLSKTEDLTALAANSGDWSAAFKMTADIALTAEFSGIGNVSNPFSGIFDGGGFSIEGLKMTSSANATGLFPYVNGGTIRFLALPDAVITGGTFVGALVGIAHSGNISECYTSGTVNGSGICVGGLIGSNEGAQIRDCYSTSSVNNSSDNATGGFVGKNTGVITNAYSTGSVNGHEFVGGFVGANYSTISNCAAINNPMLSQQQFVARFGGNHNDQNTSTNNISWKSIRLNTENSWSDFGDHAETKTKSVLSSQDCFSSTLGWNFPTIWTWNSGNYPLLTAIKSQKATYPTLFEDLEETGISEDYTSSSAIRVYPNPTSDNLYIETNDNSDAVSVHLFDVAGKLILNTTVAGDNTPVDLSSLQNGIYILKVYTVNNDLLFVDKIIKK